MTRTSTGNVRVEPTGRTSRSWIARSSLGCRSSGSSPISSSSSVPRVGLPEQPALRLVGARERAARVPEQLAFDQRRRQRRAVDRDQLALAPAQAVDLLGDVLLAGAGLADEQHRRRIGGDPRHVRAQRARQRRLARDRRARRARFIRGTGGRASGGLIHGDHRRPQTDHRAVGQRQSRRRPEPNRRTIRSGCRDRRRCDSRRPRPIRSRSACARPTRPSASDPSRDRAWRPISSRSIGIGIVAASSGGMTTRSSAAGPLPLPRSAPRRRHRRLLAGIVRHRDPRGYRGGRIGESRPGPASKGRAQVDAPLQSRFFFRTTSIWRRSPARTKSNCRSNPRPRRMRRFARPGARRPMGHPCGSVTGSAAPDVRCDR